MSRLELVKFVKGQKVDWGKIKNRHTQALLIVKNSRPKEYPLKQVEAVLRKELSHLKIDPDTKVLTGMTAFKGKVIGTVVKVMSKDEYKKITKGSILVIPMTKPDIVPYLKNIKGIVTNDGGALCHASIISREMEIPCVVGTKHATDIFKDGDSVEINANAGVVRKT